MPVGPTGPSRTGIRRLCYRYEMEQRILERVSREFKDSDRETVVELLESYAGPETDRVRWDILELSKGGVDNVRQYMQAAQTDYRDVLYWAEYYKDDPILRDRDPKKMIDEILAKCGRKTGRGD
jgi:hypothetical protein